MFKIIVCFALNIFCLVYSFSKLKAYDINIQYELGKNYKPFQRMAQFHPWKQPFYQLKTFIEDKRRKVKNIFLTLKGDNLYYCFSHNKNETYKTEDYYNFYNCMPNHNIFYFYLNDEYLEPLFLPLKDNELHFLGDLQIADPKLKNINSYRVTITDKFYLTKNVEIINFSSGVILCYKNKLYCLQKILKKYMIANHKYSDDKIDFLDNSVILFLWNLIKINENFNKTSPMLMGLARNKTNGKHFHWSMLLNKNIEKLLDLEDVN